MEHLQAELLLVVATEVELTAVLEAAKCHPGGPRTVGQRHGRDRSYLDLGHIGGTSVFLLQTEAGTSTVGGALTSLLSAIEEIRPRAVIMVGIAFGIDPKKHPIGTVLVSKQVLQYEIQRAGTNALGELEVKSRGDKVTATARVLSRLRAAVPNFKDAQVEFGLLLSGEKLVDNVDFRGQLQAIASEAIGGEMEASGLYVAATEKKADWCVVKAVCDYADGKKKVQKKKRQSAAALTAARFVISAIEGGGFGTREAVAGQGPFDKKLANMQHRRDTQTLKSVFCCLPDEVVSPHFENAHFGWFTHRDLWFYESFNGVMQGASLHLHDPEAWRLLDAFRADWQLMMRCPNLTDVGHKIQFSENPFEAAATRSRARREWNSGVAKAETSYRAFVGYVAKNFAALDLASAASSGLKAWRRDTREVRALLTRVEAPESR